MSSKAGFLFLLSLAGQALAAPTPAANETTPAKFASKFRVDISGTGPSYSGDGSPADGWPSESAWMTFDQLWSLNVGTINSACVSGPQNSATETSQLQSAILTAASNCGVDSRHILATVMQESHGCVRVGATSGGNLNPGLMQDHNGDYNCAGAPVGGCSQTEIQGMINDGTCGTLYKGSAGGSGLQQELQKAPSLGGSSTSQDVYIASRLYNSGDYSYAAGDNLSAPPDGTASYSSDIANRLIGYVF